jgi:hypothetical protein
MRSFKRPAAARTSGSSPQTRAAGADAQAQLGNAAILERMKSARVTEQSADDRIGQTSTPGSAGADGVRAGAGAEGAAEDVKAKASLIRGDKWGGTFGGERANRRGGAGDYGMGRLGRGASDGWSNGSGETSAGGNTMREEEQARDGMIKDQTDALSGMSDKEQEAYFADQFYCGFSSLAEFQAYADQVKSEAGTTTPVGDENFSGKGQQAPAPLGRREGIPSRTSGAAGGPSDGRGDVNATGSGASGQDSKNIERQAGGAAGAERKERASDLSYEQMMKANFHTDPKRRTT